MRIPVQHVNLAEVRDAIAEMVTVRIGPHLAGSGKVTVCMRDPNIEAPCQGGGSDEGLGGGLGRGLQHAAKIGSLTHPQAGINGRFPRDCNKV
jgi:hypothetical protein